MKKFSIMSVLLTVLSIMSLSFAHAGIITIDDFSDDQGPLSATVGNVTSSSVLGSMIGGERDIRLTSFSGLFPEMDSTANVTNGVFSFNSDSTVVSQFTIQWDGIDGSSEINTNGLATNGVGIDLSSSANSFMTTTLFADFDYFFSTTVWWADGTESETVTLRGPGNSDYLTPREGSFEFDLFEFADFTDVSALQVIGNVGAPCCFDDRFGSAIAPGSRVSAFDVTVDRIDAVSVPEPKSAGILLLGGLALMGSGVAARRKNKRNL